MGVFATVYGVFIALSSYIASLQSTALAGYVGHLGLFKSYVKDEVDKLNRIHLDKVDTHVWYNIAFPNAKSGDVSSCSEYRSAVLHIKRAIELTNQDIQSPKGIYSYRKHQSRIIEAFKGLGFQLGFMTKNDFLAVENELLALLDSVNQSFCDNVPALRKVHRAYL